MSLLSLYINAIVIYPCLVKVADAQLLNGATVCKMDLTDQ